MAVSDLFKADPPKEPITDEAQIKKQYRYWRFRVFYGMYIGYAVFYFTRKSFTFAMPVLAADLGFAKSDLGFLCSLGAIAYGVSKFLSGVISDRANLRYFMGVGLIMTGIFNFLVGVQFFTRAISSSWAAFHSVHSASRVQFFAREISCS